MNFEYKPAAKWWLETEVLSLKQRRQINSDEQQLPSITNVQVHREDKKPTAEALMKFISQHATAVATYS